MHGQLIMYVFFNEVYYNYSNNTHTLYHTGILDSIYKRVVEGGRGWYVLGTKLMCRGNTFLQTVPYSLKLARVFLILECPVVIRIKVLQL